MKELVQRCFVLVFAIALAACGSDNSAVTQQPEVSLNPSGLTPLAAVVSLETLKPRTIILEISDGATVRRVKSRNMATKHQVPVLGLRPNTAYSIAVATKNASGQKVELTEASGPLSLVTDPLPDDFPDIEVHVSQPNLMEPGYTLLDQFRRARTADRSLKSYSIILDSDGQVVWYSTKGDSNMRQLPNGNLIYREGEDVYEMTMLGEELNHVELADPGLGLHHDLSPTSDGNYLSISREKVVFDNYPTNYEDPIPRQVADVRIDPIVEFSEDGDLLNIWYLRDMLDTSRIGYIGLGERDDEGLDWAHVNAVIHDPRDDSIIVSVRHQDAVVKFDRKTGALKWILGPHDNWSPEFAEYLLKPTGAEFEWQYHQHAPMITSAGALILFDNGNNRTSPFDGLVPVSDDANYSRAVEYEIDEDNMEVSQVWEYGKFSSPRLFANFIGDADSLSQTNNALITFGGTQYIDGVAPSSIGYGDVVAKIVEVTRGKTKVFDVTISNSSPGSRVSIYRSERISELYPADYIVQTVE